jgi:hypothetical protein
VATLTTFDFSELCPGAGKNLKKKTLGAKILKKALNMMM